MINIACEFGEENRLKGVLTWPIEKRHENLALVLISAGFTAKMGPYRLYAESARTLADIGIATLRFDLGGIGNSQILNSGMALGARTNQDIRGALDYLQEEHGITDFVLGGLCSGAEDAFCYAEDDARVKGVLLIDPHAYRTKMWPVRNVLSRRFFNRLIYKALRVCRIINTAGDELDSSGGAGLESELIDYKYLSLQESSRILKKLLDRQVYLHYVYTGGRIGRFNHKRQIFGMFEGLEFDRYLTLDYIPHIEHTQVFEEDRKALVTAITRRLGATYR